MRPSIVLLFFASIVMSFTAAKPSAPAKTVFYINRYAKLATYEMIKSNIPASIKLAQAIVESDWGQSELANRSNNHFCIKASNWDGKVVYALDDDYRNGKKIASPFRKYESVEQSYADHSNFLKNSTRYNTLFKIPRTDYRAWARGLVRCGYTTDKTYSDNLIRVIEMYNLNRFDIPEILIAGSDEEFRAHQLLESLRHMDVPASVDDLPTTPAPSFHTPQLVATATFASLKTENKSPKVKKAGKKKTKAKRKSRV
jgi:hypothetical protein